jgi:ribonuclease BN (tRNA processing enzyme)
MPINFFFTGGELAELIILGSGTGIPSLRRGPPGFLIISDTTKVLIDSGAGTLRTMLRMGITYRDIDLLLYTHTHPDHISEFVPILFASKYSELPREKDLLSIGGAGFKHYFEQIKRVYGRWIEPQTYHLSIREISEEPLLFNDMKIFSKPMSHISESVGYRVELKDRRSITISGDTDYCENIVELGFEASLLVLECSFPDERKIEGHLTPSLAGKIGLESHCKRLLLTHLYPVCDQFDILGQCRQVYPGETILGEDLMRIKI